MWRKCIFCGTKIKKKDWTEGIFSKKELRKIKKKKMRLSGVCELCKSEIGFSGLVKDILY